MHTPYLEITFRNGRIIAAYYYLPREAGQRSHRTQRMESGLVVDFDAAGKPIGVEITAPSVFTLEALNRVLHELGQPAAAPSDFAPLRAA